MTEPAAAPLADAAARDAALDVARSCIVQAPAGSGKTTLLVGRVLRLLAIVERPEQILAITFTIKAAAEMRDRVLRALTNPNEAEADGARANSVARGWQLETHPSRLRIQTIDAFAMHLVRQLPVTAKLQQPAIAPHPELLYGQAVDRLLAEVGGDEAIAEFLALHDQRTNSARALLVTMLGRREQWLPMLLNVLGDGAGGTLRQQLGAATRDIQGDATRAFESELARYSGLRAELLSIARRAAENLQMPPPGTEPEAEDWRFISHLLLVTDATLLRPKRRRAVTVKQGFPAVGKEPGRAEREAFKNAMLELLQRVADDEPLLRAAYAVREMPALDISDGTIGHLQLVAQVLLQAVVKLNDLFDERGLVDFNQLTLAATTALGSEEQPTELALALDYRIRHLLVDEFQDTSRAQYALFQRLVAEWQPGDGNTFFAVGDPMQSIYRFRNAEVGMFLETCRRGISGLPLDTLRLTSNFRSTAPLIEWFNTTFARVMGRSDDPNLGRIAYSRATSPPSAAAGPANPVALHLLPDAAAHYQKASTRVRELLDAGAAAKDIAILVRSRMALPELIRALDAARIPWQGIELHPLADSAVVSDLGVLARTLADPWDTPAWCALLRSPLVGLTLADLYGVRQAGEHFTDSLEAALQGGAETLSDDGRLRCERLQQVLSVWWPRRLAFSPRDWVESVWHQLGGLAAYGPGQAANAERLLDTLEREYPQRLDPARLALDLAGLYASDLREGVQIMTIHKAKGLQFKHVLLTDLQQAGRRDDPPLLAARETYNGLLLARRREQNYDWLKLEQSERARNELQRLLYVGATRAECTLDLLAIVEHSKGPPSNSLLHALQPAIAEQVEAARQALADDGRYASDAPAAPPSFKRLPASVVASAPPVAPPATLRTGTGMGTDFDNATLRFAPARRLAVLRGDLIHAALCELAASPSDDPESFLTPRQRHWRQAAHLHGFDADTANALCTRISEQITALWHSALGRWCVLTKHLEAAAEAPYAFWNGKQLQKLVLDRTFVTGGERWVIDYKSAAPDQPDLLGDPTQEWQQEQCGRYAGQLAGYRRALAALHPDEPPCRTALYYTALDLLWELPAPSAERSGEIVTHRTPPDAAGTGA